MNRGPSGEMAPVIHDNWKSLLGESPRIAPDVIFKVTEELSIDGNTVERTEVVGAHKFVLSVASDVFEAQFYSQIPDEWAEISITVKSIQAFKEFLKLIYGLFIGNMGVCTSEAEILPEVLNLCKKYEVQDAISLIDNRDTFLNIGQGCVKQESQTVQNDMIKVEKKGGSNIKKYEEEVDEKKIVKTEVYCILCQEYGHSFSEECISSAICFGCGIKGHVKRDCEKIKRELNKIKHEEIKTESSECDEEYVEMEIAKDGTKIELGLESEEDYVYTADKMSKKNSLKRCSADLSKENIDQAPSISKCSSNPRKVMGSKHEEGSHSSEKCDYKAQTKSTLSKHIKEHYCEECDYHTKKKSYLLQHIQAIHKGIQYSCEKCDYKSDFKHSLRKHVKVKHEGVTYACKKCDFVSKNYSALIQHKKSVHEGIRYSCDKCIFQSKYKNLLLRHTQAEHQGVKYACDKCDYVAKRKDFLSEHMEAKHEGIRHTCEKCDYTSKYKRELSKHMRKHHKMEK